MEDETEVVDFFDVNIFLVTLPPPVKWSGTASAAVFALVTRVDPIFSSFSLWTARCLTKRACCVLVLGKDGTCSPLS